MKIDVPWAIERLNQIVSEKDFYPVCSLHVGADGLVMRLSARAIVLPGNALLEIEKLARKLNGYFLVGVLRHEHEESRNESSDPLSGGHDHRESCEGRMGWVC